MSFDLAPDLASNVHRRLWMAINQRLSNPLPLFTRLAPFMSFFLKPISPWLKWAQVLVFRFICPFDALGFAFLQHVFLHLLKRPLNWARQQQSLKKHLSPDQGVKLETWALQLSIMTIRLMIGIEPKYLHKMVPSWHRHWHFHAKENCYNSSNSPATPWKFFASGPKIGFRVGPKFWKIRPEKFPPKIWNSPKIFEATFTVVWVTKLFRFGNLKNFRLRPLVESWDFRVTEIRNFSPESLLIWQLIFLFLFICSPLQKDLNWQLWSETVLIPIMKHPHSGIVVVWT